MALFGKKDPQAALLRRLRKEKPLRGREVDGLTLPVLEAMRGFWPGLSPAYRQDVAGAMAAAGLTRAIAAGLTGKSGNWSGEDAAALIIALDSRYFRRDIEELLFSETPLLPARLAEVLAASAWSLELLPEIGALDLPKKMALLQAAAIRGAVGIAALAAALLPQAPPEWRGEIVALLGRTKEEAALGPLLDCLAARDWRLRLRAAQALADWEDRRILPHLEAAAAAAEGPLAYVLAAAIERHKNAAINKEE